MLGVRVVACSTLLKKPECHNLNFPHGYGHIYVQTLSVLREVSAIRLKRVTAKTSRFKDGTYIKEI
jgi:hypothetical protein